MDIITTAIGLISSASLLTLHSMKEFLDEVNNNQTSTEITHISTNKTFPLIFDNVEDFKQYILKQLEYIKQSNGIDVTIEKIKVGESIQYAVYRPGDTSLWEDIPRDKLKVVESFDKSVSEALAKQYIVRHKYEDVFYISQKAVINSTEYSSGAIDEILWNSFYNRVHNHTPQITTKERVVNSLVESKERRLT